MRHYKKKICEICDKYYQPTGNCQKYCVSCKLTMKKQQDNQYYSFHRQKIINTTKLYQEKNKKKYQEYYKRYRQTHKKERKQYEKIHRKQINKKQQEYYYNHKKEWNLRAKRYLQNNLNARIRNYLASRIRKVLKNSIKTKKTVELIGCSISKLKRYLENRFQKDMNWENYGFYGWHIDHIKPCVKFDLSKLSEQKKCFNYKNLQPLWAKENLSKGGKYGQEK